MSFFAFAAIALKLKSIKILKLLQSNDFRIFIVIRYLYSIPNVGLTSRWKKFEKNREV
ncbi:MAG: hypothetical protein ACK5UZ_12520 [Pseudanabaena sp.]